MEAMKKFTVWVLVFLLLICECITMGIFALDTGSSRYSVRDALTSSAIVAEMTQASLEANTVNMGGEYGEIMSDIMNSPAMTDFFTEYIATGLRGMIYGTQYEEIAMDELMRAFEKGMDQVNADGDYDIGPDQRLYFLDALENAAPDLTAGLDTVMGQYEITATGSTDNAVSRLQITQAIRPLLAPMARAILLAVIACIILLLLALAGFRARGAIWAALTTLLASGLYGLLALRGTGETDGAADVFLNTLIQDGAMMVAICGGFITLVLLIFAIILGRKKRRRVSEDDLYV